ncbi:YjbE family putative metal transport protein [Paenibacillus filicis]|uniref:YjbE family putative metal transport protein n=1 Tax=Paenibacillus gyeongsangnamensis TaxID=3388067 RepID=A0ABT4Q5B4_9BACL|nr:YjbE family putative metal transport protein [Paenibacillus filicis]MCZ8512059.1 YjbE family putative metal transport protein [Paenibacillus filicis]
MEWFSPEFFTALLSIIIIDLVLAGDNAIVIGLAARNLAKEHQKKAILWGTAGAVAIRAVATLLVVWLLKIPALLIVGGIVLIWIAYKLLTDKKEHDIKAQSKLLPAIQTIIVADAVMGFDNVMAVAGASHGSFGLVLAGLLISVPIVVWGSTVFIRWVERFPRIIYLGAGVLAYTAGKMLTGDLLVKSWFAAHGAAKWALILAVVAGVLAAGLWKKAFGFLVSVNDRGQLTIPKELMQEANIQPDDSFRVSKDEKGRFVLVKLEG